MRFPGRKGLPILQAYYVNLEVEVDGQAVAAGLESSVGSDWLKDIVPKLGLRLKST